MKVLVPLLPGLGDALMASPILRAVIDAGAELDILTMLEPVADYARALDQVRDVIQIPLLNGKLRDYLCTLSLRHRAYDLLVLPYPAMRWQYAAVAGVIKAKRTITHDYGLSSRLFAKYSGFTLVPIGNDHRVTTNRTLAVAAGLPVSNDLNYLMPFSWHSIYKFQNVIGVHAGTMNYKGNDARRWPFENFLALISQQIELGRHVRLFVGPNEGEHAIATAGRRDLSSLEIVHTDTKTAAQSISECSLFLSNDSGLAHVSSGLGVPTIVLYGMTDPERVLPKGPAIAVRESLCPPCFNERIGSFECIRRINFRCLNRDLSVATVSGQIDRAFSLHDVDGQGSLPAKSSK